MKHITTPLLLTRPRLHGLPWFSYSEYTATRRIYFKMAFVWNGISGNVINTCVMEHWNHNMWHLIILLDYSIPLSLISVLHVNCIDKCKALCGVYMLYAIITLVRHKKARFDSKMHGSTQKSPVRHKNARFDTKMPYPACTSGHCHYQTSPRPFCDKYFFSNFILIFCF